MANTGGHPAGEPPAADNGSQDDLEPRPDLAQLAHELRTPLGAIAVLAEIMRDERLGPLGSPRYKGYVADIHQSAAHANAVLVGWLEAAHGAREHVGTLDFTELDLGEVVSGAVSALELLAERAGVGLTFELSSNLPHVIADRRGVRQILNNLIANALKFTPPGGHVVVHLDYGGSGPVRLEVADTGDGMTEDELARARSSKPGPDALRRRSGGTGIGLPLVRALAAACGATFEIDSCPGKGCRARIVFPHDRVVPV